MKMFKIRSELPTQFLFFTAYILKDQWQYIFSSSQRCQQICLFPREQATFQLAVGSQSHAVTAAAERGAHRADDGERSHMPRYAVRFCRVMLIARQRIDHKLFLHPGKDLLQGDHFVAGPPVAAKRHKFDKTYMNRSVPRPADKIVDLHVIDSLHDNRIHLYM